MFLFIADVHNVKRRIEFHSFKKKKVVRSFQNWTNNLHNLKRATNYSFEFNAVHL